MVGHSIEVRATFEQDVTRDAAIAALEDFPNLTVKDVPTPLEAAGLDETFVDASAKTSPTRRASTSSSWATTSSRARRSNTVQLAELVAQRRAATA